MKAETIVVEEVQPSHHKEDSIMKIEEVMMTNEQAKAAIRIEDSSGVLSEEVNHLEDCDVHSIDDGLVQGAYQDDDIKHHHEIFKSNENKYSEPYEHDHISQHT